MEKKKRVRPSWMQVRELEDEVSRQLKEQTGWRRQCHELMEERDANKQRLMTVEEDLAHVSNTSANRMELYLQKAKECAVLDKQVDELKLRLERMRHRSLWQRIVNAEV